MLALVLAAVGASFAATALLTPLVRALARVSGAVDRPGIRKIHLYPIPRWGGIAVALGFGAGIAALFAFPRFRALLDYSWRMSHGPFAGSLLEIDQQLIGVAIGAGIVLGVGMRDDVRPLPASLKLLLQIIAAMTVAYLGVFIGGFRLPGMTEYHSLSKLGSLLLTAAWLLGFMNAMNLVDGLDGLATGVAAIAAFSFLTVAVVLGHSQTVYIAKQQKLAMLLAAALLGACMGFLLHNFHPARIFLGDSGSLFLGMMLGSISIVGALKTTAVVAILLPLIVIALPVADVAMAILRRLRRKKPVMAPDREHLHHRLLAMGLSHREVVLSIYTATLMLSHIALAVAAWRGT